ncbi:hypothetical protein HY932_00145 [Candidatus Falkowbacteria bacterium]|nr:hypothetical protein [Candidatus Falkowbacteria bacterium]
MEKDEILSLAVELLREEEEFLVPILKLHKLILDEKENCDLNIEELTKLLIADDRFYILESQSTQEPWEDDDDDKMEALGFYKGPRVMLVERKPSKEELAAAIKESMQQMLYGLKQACHANPEDTEETEFLQIMTKAKDLERKFDDAFKKDDGDK